MRLDALVHQIKNVARWPDGDEKQELFAIAEELLSEYVEQREITDDARQMLLRLLRPDSRLSDDQNLE